MLLTPFYFVFEMRVITKGLFEVCLSSYKQFVKLCICKTRIYTVRTDLGGFVSGVSKHTLSNH